MAYYFDEKKWEQELIYPDWYDYLKPEYVKLVKLANEVSQEERRKIKDEVYSFFEKALGDNKVHLAKSGPNLDEERLPIDTVVIHHTHHEESMTIERLNAIHLVRLYTGYETTTDRKRGEPIWSNHFNKEGKQVFYAYHWFVRQDGAVVRLLNDNEIGWQAGNWNINCRSVGICVDDNLENKIPGDKVTESIRKIIAKQYPQIKKGNIVGHREVNPKTTCPGNTFLHGWKEQIAIS